MTVPDPHPDNSFPPASFPQALRYPPYPAAPSSRMPLVIGLVSLALGGAAIVLSVWALVTASGKQQAPAFAGDSKTRVCAAFDTTSKAVLAQTNANIGPEPVQQAVVAANARLSLLGGGDYLLRQLDRDTPRELTRAVTAFANDIQTLGINYLAGAVSSDPAQAELTRQADEAMARITELCN